MLKRERNYPTWQGSLHLNLSQVIECPAQFLSKGHGGDHGGHAGQDQADVFPREGAAARDCTRTGLSWNTSRTWLRQPEATEPKYPKRKGPSVVDAWGGQLEERLRTDNHRAKRERRTARFMFEAIRAQGFEGSYTRVSEFVQRWREQQAQAPRRQAYVPLVFDLGGAFQFDWSCEYVFVGGLRQRLEVAHVKLNASRAFWLVAYPTQRHEMLFDTHVPSLLRSEVQSNVSSGRNALERPQYVRLRPKLMG